MAIVYFIFNALIKWRYLLNRLHTYNKNNVIHYYYLLGIHLDLKARKKHFYVNQHILLPGTVKRTAVKAVSKLWDEH